MDNAGYRIKSSEIFSRSSNDLGKSLNNFILFPRLQNKTACLTCKNCCTVLQISVLRVGESLQILDFF